MILAIIFLILAFLIGIILSEKLKINSSLKLPFSIIIGTIISTWTVFIFSYLFKNIKFGIISSIILSIIIIFIFRKNINFHLKFKKSEKIILIIFLLASSLLILNNLAIPKEDKYYFGINSWADSAFHLTLINSFSKTDNYPPSYPIYANQKMGYPFLYDYLSSTLNYLGMNLELSFILPTIIFLTLLLYLVYILALKLTNKKSIAIIALILLVFSGGLGFIDIVKGTNCKEIDPTSSNPAKYAFANFIANMINQRTALFGFMTTTLFFTLLIPKLIKNQNINKNNLIILGFLSSLTLFFHTHSFLSLNLLVFVLSIYYKRKDFLYFFIPAGIIAILQAPLFLGQVTEGKFLGFHLGWLAPKGFIPFVSFWITNLGILLFLYIASFIILNKKFKILYAASLILFITPNIIKFSPWIYDNLKIMMFWLLFVSTAASQVLYYLYKNIKFGKIISILLFILSILSGLIVVSCFLTNIYPLYSNSEIEIANWIDSNTKKDAVFLTASTHNHLVSMLAGRTIYRGYDGWLWSHGINDSRKQIQKGIFEGKLTKNEIKNLDIDYIFIGTPELNSPDFSINISSLSQNLKTIYKDRNTIILKI